MKSSFIFLSFCQYIFCKNDFVVVKNVYFLENNFWLFTNQNQTDKGFLHRVAVYFENNKSIRCGYINITSFCHYLSLTNRRYTLLSDKMSDYIECFKHSSTTDHFILNFEFFFTDSVVNYSYLDEYYAEVRSYKTFKMLEKAPDKIDLRLVNDCKEIRVYFMKKLMVNLSKMKLLKIDEYISAMEEQFSEDKFKTIEDTAKFKLYHFKNYVECLESILRFVKNLDHLNSLIDDDVVNSIVYKFFVLPINSKPALKVSTFIDSLRKRYKHKNMEKKKLTGFITTTFELFSKLIKPILNKTRKNIEFLIDACFDHINLEIMNNNIFLPINDKYNIDFYLLMLTNITQNIVESILRIHDITKPQSKDIIFQYQIKILDKKLRNLQDSVIKDLCEAKYFYYCFSKLLKIDIETLDDYKIIERMMCDYNNVLVFLTSLNTIKSRFYFQFNYLQPLFIDDYSCRIVDGFVMKFDDSVYLESIKAFNCEDNEISIKEEIDYFTEKVDKSYFFITEILKSKNINLIEITIHVYVFKKKFKIFKILYV